MLKKRMGILLLSILCLLLTAAPQILNKGLLFKTGTSYTIYAGSASSNAKIILCKEGRELFTKLFTGEVTGESAAYAQTETAVAEAKRLGARFLFSETAAGVTNYYGYSPRIAGGIILYGKKINVHVAVSEHGSAIGSPLIFGGY